MLIRVFSSFSTCNGWCKSFRWLFPWKFADSWKYRGWTPKSVHRYCFAVSFTMLMWLLLDQSNVDWMCSVTRCLLSLWPWWGQWTLQSFSCPLSNEDTGSFWPHGCKGRLRGCEELGHCATVMRTRQEKNFSSNERKILSIYRNPYIYMDPYIEIYLSYQCLLSPYTSNGGNQN